MKRVIQMAAVLVAASGISAAALAQGNAGNAPQDRGNRAQADAAAGQQRGADAAAEGQKRGAEAAAEGQKRGAAAAAEGQKRGAEAAAEGQKRGAEAAAAGQQRGAEAGAAGQQRAGEAQDAASTRLDPSTVANGEEVVSQMEREETKHRERVARLEAVREQLTQKGNAAAATKVDAVLQKEQQRYDAAMQRLQQRDQKAAERFEQKLQRVKEQDEKSPKGGPRGKGNAQRR